MSDSTQGDGKQEQGDDTDNSDGDPMTSAEQVSGMPSGVELTDEEREFIETYECVDWTIDRTGLLFGALMVKTAPGGPLGVSLSADGELETPYLDVVSDDEEVVFAMGNDSEPEVDLELALAPDEAERLANQIKLAAECARNSFDIETRLQSTELPPE